MRGYKGFDKDLKCRGFQYEVGKTYKHNGEVTLCESGFHFCKELSQTFDFYDKYESRFCEVESPNPIVTDKKCVTDTITIIRELEPKEIFRTIYGNGNGDGYGDGNGYGYGNGNGNGYGYGYGNGNGNGYGYGYDYGNGYGYGDGYGDGYGSINKILNCR